MSMGGGAWTGKQLCMGSRGMDMILSRQPHTGVGKAGIWNLHPNVLQRHLVWSFRCSPFLQSESNDIFGRFSSLLLLFVFVIS